MSNEERNREIARFSFKSLPGGGANIRDRWYELEASNAPDISPRPSPPKHPGIVGEVAPACRRSDPPRARMDGVWSPPAGSNGRLWSAHVPLRTQWHLMHEATVR